MSSSNNARIGSPSGTSDRVVNGASARPRIPRGAGPEKDELGVPRGVQSGSFRGLDCYWLMIV
jgi:hypothetical protein